MLASCAGSAFIPENNCFADLEVSVAGRNDPFDAAPGVGQDPSLNRLECLPTPGDVVVLSGEAGLSATLGRWDDALRQWRAALSQDPLNADVLQSLSGMQEIHGNLREAEATMRRALEIHPTYAYGHYNVGYILLERGDRDGALREIEQEAISDAKQQGLALIYYALGRKADANAALAALIKEEADGSAFSIAQVYAFRGQSDEAMHWLERAYGQKDPFLWQIKSISLMKRLETDPRYKAFILKMNLPE